MKDSTNIHDLARTTGRTSPGGASIDDNPENGSAYKKTGKANEKGEIPGPEDVITGPLDDNTNPDSGSA